MKEGSCKDLGSEPIQYNINIKQEIVSNDGQEPETMFCNVVIKEEPVGLDDTLNEMMDPDVNSVKSEQRSGEGEDSCNGCPHDEERDTHHSVNLNKAHDNNEQPPYVYINIPAVPIETDQSPKESGQGKIVTVMYLEKGGKANGDQIKTVMYDSNGVKLAPRGEKVAKTYAQRQKEYRMRKKMEKERLGLKKIPKTNAEHQQKFRQKLKEKLQKDEALKLARKQKDAERAKRYRDKMKLKKLCADSDISSKNTLPTELIENNKDTNSEELMFSQFQMQSINEAQQDIRPSFPLEVPDDEYSTPKMLLHHEIDNDKTDVNVLSCMTSSSKSIEKECSYKDLGNTIQYDINIKQEIVSNDIEQEPEAMFCTVEIKEEPLELDLDTSLNEMIDPDVNRVKTEQRLAEEENRYSCSAAVPEETDRSQESGQGKKVTALSLEKDRIVNGVRTKTIRTSNGKKVGPRGADMDQKTQLIIEAVKNYPVLYDVTHPDYKQNKIKSKIWDDIAVHIEERSGDAVKSRWRNLKDAYNKYLRANKTDQAAKTVERYKSWPWGEQMSFLQPYLVFASDSNIQTEYQIEDSTIEEPDSSQLLSAQHSCRLEASPSQPFSADRFDEPQSHQHTRKRKSNPKESQGDELSSKRRYTAHDETDLIFLGYSRTIKQMSKSRQARVKFQIAKLMMEAELKDAEESSKS